MGGEKHANVTVTIFVQPLFNFVYYQLVMSNIANDSREWFQEGYQSTFEVTIDVSASVDDDKSTQIMYR